MLRPHLLGHFLSAPQCNSRATDDFPFEAGCSYDCVPVCALDVALEFPCDFDDSKCWSIMSRFMMNRFAPAISILGEQDRAVGVAKGLEEMYEQ